MERSQDNNTAHNGDTRDIISYRPISLLFDMYNCSDECYKKKKKKKKKKGKGSGRKPANRTGSFQERFTQPSIISIQLS